MEDEQGVCEEEEKEGQRVGEKEEKEQKDEEERKEEVEVEEGVMCDEGRRVGIQRQRGG